MDRQSVDAIVIVFFCTFQTFFRFPNNFSIVSISIFHSCLKNVNAGHCLLEHSRAQYLDIANKAFTFRCWMDRHSVNALTQSNYLKNITQSKSLAFEIVVDSNLI